MKPFYEQPFTRLDNWIIDSLMQTVNGNEFKTLICIMRYTVGWHQTHEIVTYAQIKQMTGIKSNTTVSNCLQSLLDKQYIIRQCVGHHSEFETPIWVYAINRDYEVENSEIEHLSSPISGQVPSPKNGQGEGLPCPISGQVPSPISGQSERKKEIRDHDLFEKFLNTLSLNFGTKAMYQNIFGYCEFVDYEDGVLTIDLKNSNALDTAINHPGAKRVIQRSIEQVESLKDVRFLAQD